MFTYLLTTYLVKIDLSVCLSVCWSQSWALLKWYNWSRCRLGDGLACSRWGLTGKGAICGTDWPIENHWESLLWCIIRPSITAWWEDCCIWLLCSQLVDVSLCCAPSKIHPLQCSLLSEFFDHYFLRLLLCRLETHLFTFWLLPCCASAAFVNLWQIIIFITGPPTYSAVRSLVSVVVVCQGL